MFARQQQPDRGLHLKGRVRQPWPAGTEDHLRRDVNVQFRLQRGLDVDLGQDAEALVGQGFAGGCQRIGERAADRGGQCVRHLGSRFGYLVQDAAMTDCDSVTSALMSSMFSSRTKATTGSPGYLQRPASMQRSYPGIMEKR